MKWRGMRQVWERDVKLITKILLENTKILKLSLKEMWYVSVDWIRLAEGKDSWCAAVHMIMKIFSFLKGGDSWIAQWWFASQVVFCSMGLSASTYLSKFELNSCVCSSGAVLTDGCSTMKTGEWYDWQIMKYWDFWKLIKFTQFRKLTDLFTLRIQKTVQEHITPCGSEDALNFMPTSRYWWTCNIKMTLMQTYLDQTLVFADTLYLNTVFK